MNKRYVIWDKESIVITPSGEIFTPEEWISRYPVANVLTTVVAGGDINGAYFGILSQMIDMYEAQGCDFSNCVADQDYLDTIEEFENRPIEEAEIITPEERIAAALEAQVLLSLPDEEE